MLHYGNYVAVGPEAIPHPAVQALNYKSLLQAFPRHTGSWHTWEPCVLHKTCTRKGWSHRILRKPCLEHCRAALARLHSPGDALTPDQHSRAQDQADRLIPKLPLCPIFAWYLLLVLTVLTQDHEVINLSLLVRSKVHWLNFPFLGHRYLGKTLGKKRTQLVELSLNTSSPCSSISIAQVSWAGSRFLTLDCLSWCGHGANDTKVVGSVSVWAYILLRAGLNVPCESLWTQNVLWNLFNSLW